MNPIVTLYMANGKNIVIELLPESAPNAVNSFTYTASRGYLDHHAIERIVLGNWVGVSYAAFGRKEYRYPIPNEFELDPDMVPLDSRPGIVCISGYGEAGLAGCESSFPLRDCPDHRGIYPALGRVLEGMDELHRLEKVETVPVINFPIEGVEVSRPAKPEIIERVGLKLYSEAYPKPVRVREPEFPGCRKQPCILAPYPVRYLPTFSKKYPASPGVL